MFGSTLLIWISLGQHSDVLRLGDFMFSFDLKLGYQHFDIFPKHRKFLATPCKFCDFFLDILCFQFCLSAFFHVLHIYNTVKNSSQEVERWVYWTIKDKCLGFPAAAAYTEQIKAYTFGWLKVTKERWRLFLSEQLEQPLAVAASLLVVLGFKFPMSACARSCAVSGETRAKNL